MTTPALTPEEWKFLLHADSHSHPLAGHDCEHVPEDINVWDGEHVLEIDHGMPQHPHQVAAFLLHGQPFGFTWIQVDLLNAQADEIGRTLLHGEYEMGPYAQLRELADRIAALLPPRDLK